MENGENLIGIGKAGFLMKDVELGSRQNTKIGVKRFFVRITGHVYVVNEVDI